MTRLAYSFNNGRPVTIGEEHSVDYYIMQAQRSIFSYTDEDYPGYTWSYDEDRGMGYATYTGRWSLLFEFLIDEHREIVGYFYFTADDLQTWAEQTQAELEK